MDDFQDKISLLGPDIKKKVIKRWRWLVTREIKTFVKDQIKASKFRNIKPSGRYFGMRSLKKSDAVQIFGQKPNVGLVFGVSVPVGERYPAEKAIRFKDENGWHATKTLVKTSDTLGPGVQKADVPYVGTSAKPDGNYFGTKYRRNVRVYGITNGSVYNKALPIYNSESIPDWVMNEHEEDIERIIKVCGELAIEAFT